MQLIIDRHARVCAYMYINIYIYIYTSISIYIYIFVFDLFIRICTDKEKKEHRVFIISSIMFLSRLHMALLPVVHHGILTCKYFKLLLFS